MQMPLKMARAIPDDPDGPVFQFSLITPFPSRTQCMTHATINVNIVMQWKTQIERVTPLLSRTPKRKSPVKAARIKMAMRYSGNGSFASPPIYCVPTSQCTRFKSGRSKKFRLTDAAVAADTIPVATLTKKAFQSACHSPSRREMN